MFFMDNNQCAVSLGMVEKLCSEAVLIGPTNLNKSLSPDFLSLVIKLQTKLGMHKREPRRENNS